MFTFSMMLLTAYFTIGATLVAQARYRNGPTDHWWFYPVAAVLWPVFVFLDTRVG
jgi:hypothetical protein